MSKRHTGAVRHIHKYKKMNLTRKANKEPYWVYQCILPTCTHYLPVKQTLGKLCICHRCGEQFIIGKSVLQETEGNALVLPHCDACTRTKVDKSAILTDISAFLEKEE